MSASQVGETDFPADESTQDTAVEENTTENAPSGRHGRFVVVVAVAGALVAALVILSVVLGLRGYRVYFMQTPSMGTSAPVGSLVVTQPVEVGDLGRGDVVTVAPRGGGSTHTHRVIDVAERSATTKGDLNGTPDPETVDAENLVGRAVLILPAMGWVVKMLPIILLTLLAGYLLTSRVRDPRARFRYLLLSVFCGLALSIVIVQPLLGVQLLSMNVDHREDGPFAEAHVVSTGLFPVQITPFEDAGQSSAVLAPTGTAGSAVATQAAEDGQFMFYPRLALTPGWSVVMVLYCALPFLVFGLHEFSTRRKAERGAGTA